MKTLLIHGLGQNAASWNDTLAVLPDSWDIEAPSLLDLPGAQPEYEGLYRAFCSYCAAMEDRLNLVGLSLGAILALHYASEHPDRVGKIALIGAQYRMPRFLLLVQDILFRLMPGAAFEESGLKKSDFIRLTHTMSRLDFTGRLAQVQCPACVLCGEKDGPNQKAARELSLKLPQAQLHIIPNAGHEVNKDQPEKLAEILTAFFS